MSKKCNEQNVGKIISIAYGTKKRRIRHKSILSYCEYLRNEKQPKI